MSSITAWRHLGAMTLVAVLGAGCVAAADEAGPSSDSAPTAALSSTSASASTPTSASAPTSTPTSTSDPGSETVSTGADDEAGDDADLMCRVVERLAEGSVQNEALTENSGLAASRHHGDVLWGHNDSGNEAGIFAFDRTGRDLGFFALVDNNGDPVTTIDAEDLAIVDRTIYLADIGDRGRPRDEIAIHLIPEPEVLPATETTVRVERTIRARYPDGPSDAEALAVDPSTGQVLIFSKDNNDGLAPTRVYALDPDQTNPNDEPIELAMTAVLDGVALTTAETGFSFGSLAFPGAITAADVSADGRLVAVRTYGSVWLFGRAPGQSVAQALTGVPCEARPAAETQGESVALVELTEASGDETIGVVTVGEGGRSSVNVALVEITG